MMLRVLLLCAAGLAAAAPVRAMPPETLEAVVSVLPVWPGRAQGGGATEPGLAPEGSGVAVEAGVVATAWHVIAPAERIELRLADGRILPAELLAHDVATDIALLTVEAALPVLPMAPEVAIADPVCAVGNAFGLGLSVTCGVVSATGVSHAGFNPVEDFVQTDAAINPGVSGGALVDGAGRLVGLVSAIFASEGDANIGINFAVSAELLARVTEALLTEGVFRVPEPGWRLEMPERAVLAQVAAPVVVGLAPGPARAAGIEEGDLVLEIGARRVRSPRDALAALAVLGPEDMPVEVVVMRDRGRLRLAMALEPAVAQAAPREVIGDCPHPAAVCRMRQAVFPVSSFDPLGSATRVGPGLLVTNRHVLGDRRDAVVHTPDGPRGARVLPSAYPGDLVLLEVDGLPEAGHIPDLDATSPQDAPFHAVGADIQREEVRVFAPGALISGPAEGAALGRLHVTARMQPGVSGGALVDRDGDLAGIAVGGGEGRFEAIPLADIRRLIALRDDAEAGAITEALGRDFAACATGLEAARRAPLDAQAQAALSETCLAAQNHGQLLEAGRSFGQAGDAERAVALHAAAVAQVPNSINGRMTLLVSLQFAGRFAEMTAHARWLLARAPDDPQALRFAVQSGVWGGDPELAEAGYAALLAADPGQAQAARRFIDAAPPAPVPR